jgi:putative ABC transport system ATP-binding protein
MSHVLELMGATCRLVDGERTVAALDEVSLTVDAGEVVAVVGPSGSGKSTLVHVACGLRPASPGVVVVDGEPAPPWAEAREWWNVARRDLIGVVHQRLNLVPGLSALDNVALPLRLAGSGAAAARRQAGERLGDVGAGDLATVRADRLSIGQQQLVAMARAVAGDRKVVLADEPTAALDTVRAEQVVELLGDQAQRRGVGVLMVTHDSRLASWADRVLVLRDGHVVDEVAPEASTATGSAAGAGVAVG